MKKLYKKPKFKAWHDKRAKRLKKPRNKKYDPDKLPIYKRSYKNEYVEKEPIKTPAEMSLFGNTEDCLIFFSKLRKEKNISKKGKRCFIQIDLSELKKFDYGWLCVLIAIVENLESKKVLPSGNFPSDEICKEEIIKSGLLNLMYDDKGKKFKESETSDILPIVSERNKISDAENKKIGDSLKRMMEHFTGMPQHYPPIRKILLEICGNSVEWGRTNNKQWLVGIRYVEKDRVIFTLTDIGDGILKTLYRKNNKKFKEILTFTNNTKILRNAFDKKYGSKSQKPNRNKGLPSVKNTFEKGIIKELKVLTNDVLLDFENSENDKLFKNQKFSGTLYQWEVKKESVNNFKK